MVTLPTVFASPCEAIQTFRTTSDGSSRPGCLIPKPDPRRLACQAGAGDVAGLGPEVEEFGLFYGVQTVRNAAWELVLGARGGGGL